MKSCVVCGRVSRGPRCPAHTRARGYDSPVYRRNRRALLATATRCWRCGGAPTAGDPLTADHVVPLEHGGGHDQLRAAHDSCNKRAGQLQQQGRAR